MSTLLDYKITLLIRQTKQLGSWNQYLPEKGEMAVPNNAQKYDRFFFWMLTKVWNNGQRYFMMNNEASVTDKVLLPIFWVGDSSLWRETNTVIFIYNALNANVYLSSGNSDCSWIGWGTAIPSCCDLIIAINAKPNVNFMNTNIILGSDGAIHHREGYGKFEQKLVDVTLRTTIWQYHG